MIETKKERLLWNIKILYALLQKDLYVFRLTGLKRRLINNYIWVTMLIFIYQYVGLGLLSGYGAFIATGEAALRGWYSIHNDILRIIYDAQSNRSIDYYLTLPISQTLIFVQMMIASTVRCMILASLVIPVSKLILRDHFPLSALGLIKFFIIFLCAYLFYGAMHLLIASFISNTEEFNTMRIRVSDTLFWLGAYFFTWNKLYSQSKVLAYLDLLNPCVYACEGARAALLGQTGYLPFWICCLVLLLFTLITGITAISRMKRKFDCL